MRTLDIRLHEPVRVGESPQVAYELIDLLTVILGHAALLWTALPESDQQRADVAAIVTAAERASHIASELLGQQPGGIGPS